MLEPNSRKLLLDSLEPPADYRLEWAVGTTYTLDLTALLTAPVAFAFSDWQDVEGRPTADPLALLKAVREYADRICIFCQAGKIHVPGTYQPLLANLEGSIVEAKAPRGGRFHPKIWFLRFVPSDELMPVRYRVLCMSRNMTFDRSWDTLLCLEGTLTERTNAFSRNQNLGRFVSALPEMSNRKLSNGWTKRIDQLAAEIRRVAFEIPDPFEEIQFWPIGLSDSEPWPFPQRIQRLLVVSPFVDDQLLRDLADWKAPMSLVSRTESLSRLMPESLAMFQDVWILDDTAAPEASDTEQSPDPSNADSHGSTSSNIEMPLTGLHAKIYVADNGHSASVFTGSANATYAAFYQNVEFMVELTGKKSRCGVEAILGTPDGAEKQRAARLSDLLRQYLATDASDETDSAAETFERLVDRIARDLAALNPMAMVEAGPDANCFSVTLQTRTKAKLHSAEHCRFRARPISQSGTQLFDVDLSQSQWVRIPDLSLLGLTSFFVFEVESSDHKLKRQFVLNIPLEGAPEGRRDAVLRHLLSDRSRVLRFLLLLLSDSGMSDLGGILGSPTDCNAGDGNLNSLFGESLFESLVQTLDRNPEWLDNISAVIDDLRQTPEGRKLLPEELDAIWEPVWAVRQQQIAESGDRRAVSGRRGEP